MAWADGMGLLGAAAASGDGVAAAGRPLVARCLMLRTRLRVAQVAGGDDARWLTHVQ